jgi:hypothetical protein
MATLKLRALPKSRAKTAYGLLSEIRRIILQDPRRYDQETTLRRIEARSLWYYDDAPPCGTVGCVAGWTVALKPKDAVQAVDPPGWSPVLRQAKAILGLTTGEAYVLFSGDAAGVRDPSAAGRRRHARAGAAHIARFQKAHAKHLKATRV